MGPLRRGLTLALLPCAAWAEVCDKERPMWVQATPATGFSEAAHLLASPTGIALAALLVVAAVIKLRALWVATALVWGATTCVIWLNARTPDPTGIRERAIAEGCIGPPHLSIALVAAITLLTLYMALRGPTAKEA